MSAATTVPAVSSSSSSSFTSVVDDAPVSFTTITPTSSVVSSLSGPALGGDEGFTLTVRRTDKTAHVVFYDEGDGIHEVVCTFPEIEFAIFPPLPMQRVKTYCTVHIYLPAIDKTVTQHWEMDKTEQFVEFALEAL